MTMPRTLLLPALLACALALCGCADKSTRASAPRPQTAAPASGRTTHHGAAEHKAGAPASPPEAASAEALPDRTGIPACDEYLASYRGCHRAAAIYAPDQIEARYQAMRTSLLRDSLKPDVRPQLGERCSALASQLRQALHGQPCEPEQPAPAATTSAGAGSH